MLARGLQTCKRCLMARPVRFDRRRRTLAIDAVVTAVVLLVVLASLATALQGFLGLGNAFPVRAITAFALGSTLVTGLAVRLLRAGSFGIANRVTLARGALVALLFGLVAEDAVPLTVIVTATVVLVLDGVDGWLARRFDVVSSFGARLDMETDAVLLVVLTVLVWQYGKAGPWILLAGAMRYAFVAAGAVMPFLTRPLPPRRRRQAIFVTQAIVLLVCLLPFVVQPLSGVLAFAGLALLTGSFAADVAYLTRHADRPIERRETPS